MLKQECKILLVIYAYLLFLCIIFTFLHGFKSYLERKMERFEKYIRKKEKKMGTLIEVKRTIVCSMCKLKIIPNCCTSLVFLILADKVVCYANQTTQRRILR